MVPLLISPQYLPYIDRYTLRFALYSPTASLTCIASCQLQSLNLNICAGLQVFRIIVIIYTQMWLHALYCNMRTQSCNSRKLDCELSNRTNLYKWTACPFTPILLVGTQTVLSQSLHAFIVEIIYLYSWIKLCERLSIGMSEYSIICIC